MSKQPEALRLADQLDDEVIAFVGSLTRRNAALKLREQHALIEEMREALKNLLVRVADDTEYRPDHAYTVARAAIAKAEAQS